MENKNIVLKNPSAIRIVAKEQNLEPINVFKDMKREIGDILGRFPDVKHTGYNTEVMGITGKHVPSQLYNHGSRYSYVTDGNSIVITRPDDRNYVKPIGYE